MKLEKNRLLRIKFATKFGLKVSKSHKSPIYVLWEIMENKSNLLREAVRADNVEFKEKKNSHNPDLNQMRRKGRRGSISHDNH